MLRAPARAPRAPPPRLAAAVSLVLASAKVRDHVADRDGVLARRPLAAAARRVASGWDRAGARTGADLGFDTAVLLDAVDRQSGIEALAGPGTSLLTVTEPTETATAAAFAHTAVLARRPGNVAPLAEAGRLFGRLAHLLDAVEDQAADAATGAWNPLTGTGTSRAEARRLADDAVHGVRLALRDAEFTDDRLVHVLLTHELRRAVDRAWGGPPGGGAAGGAGPPPPARPRAGAPQFTFSWGRGAAPRFSGAGEPVGDCEGRCGAVGPEPGAPVVGAAPWSPWVWSVAGPPLRTEPPGALSPPVTKVSPPGSSPDATATAPMATAAEAPSSPVRRGTPRRLAVVLR
ncbi:hypothetical protein [Streptomyces sp. NPDC058953]|uniref:hypothetical protein n=1 Tax=Streptomyces sp. NPDC058953 TaxID=3346676 RepID=UPI00369CCCCC